MGMKYLKMIVGVAAVVLLSGIAARAAEVADMRHISGEIAWVDVKLGKLQLKTDAVPATGEITEYRITPHETRVTDPGDNKFLTVDDLQPGQHVTLDVVSGKEEGIAEKITIDPRSISELKEAYGKIETVDAAGSLTLAGRSIAGRPEKTTAMEFIFEPENIVVMQNPSHEPVRLMFKPGDIVKVEFVMKQEKRLAQTITLYAPKVIRTVTTVTTTTTR